jgi:hypothetical protein
MGIEPKRKVLPELKNKRLGAMANPTCDQRVNFRGMWGNVGTHRCARSCARVFQSWVSDRPMTRPGRCRRAGREADIRTVGSWLR